MNEFLSTVITGFVSTLAVLNINTSDTGGVVPNISVPNLSMEVEQLVNTYPEALVPSNTDIVSLRDFIQDGAAEQILDNYQNRQRQYQSYVNNAAFSSGGASSYNDLLFSGIDVTGNANNAMGRTYEHTYEVGSYQATQYPIEPQIGGNVKSASNLTARFTGSTDGKSYQKTGIITVNGNEYNFVSGGSTKYPYLPAGEYSIRRHLDSRSDTSFTKDGIGFSYVIEDAQRRGSDKMYDPNLQRERVYLRIHPDGGGYGTLGCIGLTDSGSKLRQFQEDINTELKGQQSVLLTVLDENETAANQQVNDSGINTNLCFNPGAFTFNKEARLGNNEEVRVYPIDPTEGAGSFEIAGIIDIEHPTTFKRLESLIRSKQNDQAKAEIIRFYNDRSGPFVAMTQNPGLQLQFIDTVQLRGEGGLGAIIRRANGDSFNMSAGRCDTSRPTESEIATLNRNRSALDAFHLARQEYESTCIDRGRESRAPFRTSLQKRFDEAYAASKYVEQTCPSS